MHEALFSYEDERFFVGILPSNLRRREPSRAANRANRAGAPEPDTFWIRLEQLRVYATGVVIPSGTTLAHTFSGSWAGKIMSMGDAGGRKLGSRRIA